MAVRVQLSKDMFINRELSWLDWSSRVLALAEDPATPLLERVKYLSIFASTMDEFYMVRIAGIRRQAEVGLTSRSPDGLTVREQLAAINEKVGPIVQRHAHAFRDEIMPALRDAGVEILRWEELKKRQRKELDELFLERIFPVVTPLAVDPSHPFPFISNLSLSLAVLVRDPITNRSHFARVKVPPLLARLVELSEGGRFVPIEDVIAANLNKLFPGMRVLEHHAFRVTRNADLEVNDDGAEDLLEALEAELQKNRFSPAVRMEVEESMPRHVLELLTREIQIDERDVHRLPGPLDLSGLWDLYELDRPDLKDELFQPVTPSVLMPSEDTPPDMFGLLREQDLLVHHPYESFMTSFQRFIEQAADDPTVLAIKQTLYRTSGDSPIVDALIEAAEAGKQVVVLVEIKARFDERNNINWARTLERAGCHVVYGLVGLKTHCKLCLVVRQEGDELRRYVHVGTGNYNPKTARIYEDMSLFTSDREIGADVSDLFNHLTGYSRQHSYRELIVAPDEMRKTLIRMIEREAESSTSKKPGHIAIKVNSLVDERVIESLYAASRAGVQIDLFVRSICALRPGVEGISETIRVRSILGRFLEHSRIYYFRNQGLEEIYIGSADVMHRNLDRRVEVLAPVKAPELSERIKSLL
ncbi:MAG TPA: RNA degradosome polyphosphate kinase, partial [Actinomycetota bacterium]|nr:RNA degradosome polyphosphate kinase [Actinomycetota bacterium]